MPKTSECAGSDPNPLRSPPWWQLIEWIADPLGMQRRSLQSFGDLFSLRLGKFGSMVILSNPETIAELFAQETKFDTGRGNCLAAPLLGFNSLMLLDGERHQRERRLLMPAFHGERLKISADRIRRITAELSHRWKPGQRITARRAMQQISLEVIIQVVFGLQEGDRYQRLKSLLIDWINMIDSPLRSSMLFFPILQQDWGGWSPWSRMKQRQRQIHSLLQEEIEANRSCANGASKPDMLSMMLQARDEEGHAMRDEEIRDELLSMLFAGHETTATVLAWALYEIHRHPTILAKLLSELDGLGEQPMAMDIAQLPYLTAVCQETLRMYPVIPVAFPRINRLPVTIGGRDYPAETILLASIYLVHHRQELYPEPHQFKPERFLERTYSPSEYLPFGGGRRRCLGYALAEMEMKLVLATLLSDHQFALAEPDKAVQPQRRGFTLAPAGGVPLVVTGSRSRTAMMRSAAGAVPCSR